jgi:peroxiredoxin
LGLVSDAKGRLDVTSTQTTAGRTGVRPGEQAPELVVDFVGGGSWDLAAQQPQGFTLVVFYRGFHCPVCRAQLSELNRRIDELEQRGLSVIAVSGDTEELASQSKSDWHLDRLAIGYGLPERSMRAWGLFVSAGHDGEPERFNEPGLFLVKPDGSVYYEALSSMPWGRPHLDDVLNGIDYVLRSDYPARGEA